MSRIHTLDRLSEIIIDGNVTRKLDFLGTIFIHGRHYFNVYRRYNNVYEIVLEDSLGDFHFHRDYTVRESVQRIMCYTDEAISELYANDAVAFKNQAPIIEQVVDMRWTEIQARYAGAAIRLVGVPNEWYVKEEQEASPYHAVPPPLEYGSPSEPFQESQMDWGDSPFDSPSPTSSGHSCYAPKKERVEIPRGTVTRRNLSERFSALNEATSMPSEATSMPNVATSITSMPNVATSNTSITTAPKTSMENFPDCKVLRNGKKIRNSK